MDCFNAQLYSGSNKGRAGSQKIAKEGKGKESRCGFLRLNGITHSHMLLSRKTCIVEFPYLQTPGCDEKMSGGEEEKEGPDGPSLRMVLISDTHSQHDDLPKPFPKGKVNIWAVLWIRIRPWKSFEPKSGPGTGTIFLAKFFK